jgi:hypothetical protein
MRSATVRFTAAELDAMLGAINYVLQLVAIDTDQREALESSVEKMKEANLD